MDATPRHPDDYLLEGVDPDTLRLELDKFSGPFEVLLYLIKSQEIDIFDIPIVKITEQYLRFLELMEMENLDVAGEFLVMAATLIQIKSRMLLPADVEEEEEELEEEDPRLELVEKLLEYRKYRDYAEALNACADANADCYTRAVKPVLGPDPDEEEESLDVSLYDLTKAVRAMLRFLREGDVHGVMLEGASVDEKIAYIQELLMQGQDVTWRHLHAFSRSRVELVCCLLAILELCRMGRVRAHQHRNFGDIRLIAREPEEEPAAESDVVA